MQTRKKGFPMSEDMLLELARLYRQAERRVKVGQLGEDYPVERRETIPQESSCVHA